ncbi:MAG TPA: hypothetical protein VM557_12390 [Thermoanaerobaculia bacterium]|nr:hypothetical protein [Thermoanaerobaculia bacterium]
MRLIFRVLTLSLLAVVAAVPVQAEHLEADCPLSFVGGSPAVSSFASSAHGAFRNGNMVYVLRGGNLTTYETTPLGDLKIVRDDVIDTANDDVDGGTVYHNGYLFISGNAGLETFDLRNVTAGGNEPIFAGRVPGAHYGRMTASGNLLAATNPAYDLPCFAYTASCQNYVDIYNISNPANPVHIHRLHSGMVFQGFNDVAFVNGRLYTTGFGGTFGLTMTNPSSPSIAVANGVRGEFLATNGTSILAVGLENVIGVFTIGSAGQMNHFAVFDLPSIMDRGNGLRFHPDAAITDQRLITLIDEKNPMVPGGSARTIAFDVFDFSVPYYQGFDDRINENVSFVESNERMFNPIAVGPYVYVIGEVTGTQKWGACGAMAGRVELDSVRALSCGGAEIRGWVTGQNKIMNVEVFLDGDFLGNANFGAERPEISSSNPPVTWRIPVNLDQTARGTRTIRAIGTDGLGNRFQFASAQVYFPGPGRNCTSRSRPTSR